MSTFLKIFTILIVLGIATGFYFRINENEVLGDKIIGVSILATTFILLPCFLYHSWKDKDVKKYMLTNENLKKMKEKQEKKR